MATKRLELYPEQLRFIEGFNVRFDKGDIKDLQASIEERGIDVAVKARKTKDKTADDYPIYEVIDGHRRVTCAIKLTEAGKGKNDGYVMVPTDVVDGTPSIQEMTLTMLATGMNSKPLNMLEQAYAFKRLKDGGMKPSEIARQSAKSQQHVSDCLLLIEEADSKTIQTIKSGAVTASTVIEALKVAKPEEVSDTVEKVAKKKAPGKKITKKDLEEEGGKPMSSKSKSSSASYKEGATGEKTPQQKGGKHGSAIVVLQGLEEGVVANGMTPNPVAMATLKGCIELLQGKKDPIDLVGIFFSEGDLKKAEKETTAPKSPAKKTAAVADEKPAKKAPAKKATAPVEEEIDEDAEFEEAEEEAEVPAPKAKKAKAPVVEPEADDFDEDEDF